MKTIFSFLLFSLFCSYSSADEVPITIGMGGDTVWLKTGKKPAGKEDGVILPEYGVVITYGPDKSVESISLNSIFFSAATTYTLHGVGLGDNKKDVVTKLGEPTKEFPKDKEEVFDAYESVWVLKDQLLEVGFWRTDQVTPDKHKHAKDSVAWVVLRKAYF